MGMFKLLQEGEDLPDSQNRSSSELIHELLGSLRVKLHNKRSFLFRFFSGGERAGSLPESPGLPRQNQGRKDHAGNGKSSVLLLSAEVSNSHFCSSLSEPNM